MQEASLLDTELCPLIIETPLRRPGMRCIQFGHGRQLGDETEVSPDLFQLVQDSSSVGPPCTCNAIPIGFPGFASGKVSVPFPRTASRREPVVRRWRTSLRG